MAPPQRELFAGFDLQDEISIIQLVEGLQYYLGGGRSRGHSAVRDLGEQRRQTIRIIVAEMNARADFQLAVEGLLEQEGDLVEAAAGLAAYAVIDAEDILSAPPLVVESPERPHLKLSSPGEVPPVDVEEERLKAVEQNEATAIMIQEEEEATQKLSVRTPLPSLPVLDNPFVRALSLLD
jgi:hypothetical protein